MAQFDFHKRTYKSGLLLLLAVTGLAGVCLLIVASVVALVVANTPQGFLLNFGRFAHVAEFSPVTTTGRVFVLDSSIDKHLPIYTSYRILPVPMGNLYSRRNYLMRQYHALNIGVHLRNAFWRTVDWGLKFRRIDNGLHPQGRSVPGVLEINSDANWKSRIIIAVLVNTLNSDPRAIIESRLVQLSESSIGCSLSSLGGILGGAPKEDIYQEESGSTRSDSYFNPFLPRWGFIFAPIGIVTLAWGWWHIRGDRRIHLLAFIGGCLLWMYGLR
jgi:hypothetical protein